jgi:hypothetical protein
MYGVIFAVLEIIPGLAIKLLDASEMEQYLLRAAQPATLLATVGLASLTIGRRKLPFIIWTRLVATAMLLIAAFATNSTMFVAMMVMFHLSGNASLPILNAIYKENYPTQHRHSLVGNARALGMLAGALGGWCAGRYVDDANLLPTAVVGWLGGGAGLPLAEALTLSREEMLLRFRVMLVAVDLALLVSLLFIARVRLASDDDLASARQREEGGPAKMVDSINDGAPGPHAGPPGDGSSSAPSQSVDRLRRLSFRRRLTYGLRHLRDDRQFRIFMVGYFLFGFAAQMQQPVLDYFMAGELGVGATELGVAFATLPLLFGFLTMSFWGGTLDRTDPVTGRILFNLIWLVPMLLAVAATMVPRDQAVSLLYWRGLTLGFARSGSSLLWMLATLPFARHREDVVTYSAIGMALTGVRGVFAPGAGLALYHGLGMPARDVFLISVLLVFVSTWVLLRLRPETNRRFAEQPDETIVVSAGPSVITRAVS